MNSSSLNSKSLSPSFAQRFVQPGPGQGQFPFPGLDWPYASPAGTLRGIPGQYPDNLNFDPSFSPKEGSLVAAARRHSMLKVKGNTPTAILRRLNAQDKYVGVSGTLQPQFQGQGELDPSTQVPTHHVES